MKKIIGIYKITNKINKHLYIGQSRDCLRRWSDHKSKAIHSTRKDDVSKILYKAMRKYGVENFDFEIIEECAIEQLNEREQYWISFYNTYEDRHHYNRDPGGNASCEEKIRRGEDSSSAKLTTEDVIFCRELYAQGQNDAKAVWQQYFKEKISVSGFTKMYNGSSWSHVKPEVFQKRRGNRKFSYEDALYYKDLYEQSGLSLNQFAKTVKGYVGYGALWKMVNQTEFYNK